MKTKTLHNYLMIVIILISITSCVRKIYVAPGLVSCDVPGKTQCYLIKYKPDDNWIVTNNDFINFDYKQGYLYHVKASKIRVKDEGHQSKQAYKVIDVLSKSYPQTTKNEGENTYELSKFTNSGSRIKLPDSDIFVTMESGKISGFSGCNNFSGTYVINGTLLEIGPLMSTKMHCQETAEFEIQFQNCLSNCNERIMDDKEIVLSGSGCSLTFTKK